MNNTEIYKLSKMKKFTSTNFLNDALILDKTTTTTCGDKFAISIRQVQPIVTKISFAHEGCILSKSSTNAILLAIENKEKTAAIKIVQDFISMCSGQASGNNLPQELLLFKKFNKFISRRNCVVAGAKVILKKLSDE